MKLKIRAEFLSFFHSPSPPPPPSFCVCVPSHLKLFSILQLNGTKVHLAQLQCKLTEERTDFAFFFEPTNGDDVSFIGIVTCVHHKNTAEVLFRYQSPLKWCNAYFSPLLLLWLKKKRVMMSRTRAPKSKNQRTHHSDIQSKLKDFCQLSQQKKRFFHFGKSRIVCLLCAVQTEDVFDI